MSDNSSEIINEYKEQIRILRQEVAELQDAGKSKDAANKRCLQKLEHTNQDLDQANKEIKNLKEKLKKLTKVEDSDDRETLEED
jgi:peptidoglycan hydrolase CwlO-like protein